jgi:hypothetical protein
MKFTIDILSRYLGKPASLLLVEQPFKEWTFERIVETDLPKLQIDYVFPNDGIDLTCDEFDKVCTIFVYADNSRYFKDGIADMPFSATRREVAARLGTPVKSGNGHSDPILGEYGPWDRFSLDGYELHISFFTHSDRICLITIMRPDVAP